MTAKTVEDPTDVVGDGALGVTPDAIEPPSEARNGLAPQTPPIPSESPTSADSGSATGRREVADDPKTSSTSGTPSRHSTRRYKKPNNVREFASQANTVATRILNGEIDLDTARAYSAVARTVAQAVTAQTVHARFLKATPDLNFEDMEETE